VVKTPAGSANALASALDRQQWPDVVGCVAGDDTLLLIARSEKARRGLAAKLRELAGGSP
jgi:transcriptional regulator of arginine metabolism